ncbi:MAG TPA: cytochrome C [Gammaproteobacteria bacterium]|jgi:virginiamycin B lyase
MKRRIPMIATVACCAAATFTSAALAQQDRRDVDLPVGDAKPLIDGICTACHQLSFITNSVGNSKEDWSKLISTMIMLPGEQHDQITSYLAANFPKEADSYPVVIDGPVKVSITEWLAPTLGSRPHDPLIAHDGSIWWTGQFANRLGRVDPRTGAIKEYPLERPNSGPHGLVEDADGNIWYTGVSGAHVGKLDPATGDVTEYPVPEGTRGPHTPIFDQDGTLWFTMQSGHVGRIVPSTGELTVKATPTSGTYPYGIQVNSKGEPWYVDFRGNRIGQIDPETFTIVEHELPSADSRPRRIALTPDDAVWYTDYPRGRIGRFDPATGEIKEWLSPGGEKSRPYGIASVGNVIWYTEAYSRPNILVRFDTESEEFQSWVIPSGGGVVRNMMATPEGDLVLACSAVNQVALVDVES